jgi:acetyl esterase/lipase
MRTWRNLDWSKVNAMLSLQRATVFLLFPMCIAVAWAQSNPETTVALLWPHGAPGALGVDVEDQPRLTVFLPADGVERQTRMAVLVLPGGGYSGLSISQEGLPAAEWLRDHGIVAFMLFYRIGPRYHYPVELNDGSRAMRWIRSHASEYGVDPHLVGAWGFSAGGHLASILGTQFDGGNQVANDPIDRVSDRPDFLILTYPVIDQLGKAAKGSFVNLLGEHPDPEIVSQLMTDRGVTSRTPPTFLVHGNDDKWVSSENSINFYLALLHAGVPCELHIYEHGDHGFGLARADPILSTWLDLLLKWLHTRGSLNSH